MPKTIQIRGVDDHVYAGLRRRAAEAGVTVPELLRREVARIAAQPSIETRLASLPQRTPSVGRGEVDELLRKVRDDEVRR
jgi:hypothetical protein